MQCCAVKNRLCTPSDGVLRAWRLIPQEPKDAGVVQRDLAPARKGKISNYGVTRIGNAVRVPFSELEVVCVVLL